ncbi:hypothetical protein GZH53_15095 [Flavihumibacter sp. R14]|nr:hypothetical protein [Flavihumibacter soli]
MEAFETVVKIGNDFLKIFVVPFEIPQAETTSGYLLVLNDLTLGSIMMDSTGRWVTEDSLPWSDEELQIIGDMIGYHLLLSM